MLVSEATQSMAASYSSPSSLARHHRGLLGASRQGEPSLPAGWTVALSQQTEGESSILCCMGRGPFPDRLSASPDRTRIMLGWGLRGSLAVTGMGCKGSEAPGLVSSAAALSPPSPTHDL